jgi:hypothetical protein
MAKVALLIMENKRLKWIERERQAELVRLRATPVVIERPVEVKTIVQAPPCCPTCLRPYPPGWTGPGSITTAPVVSTTHLQTGPTVVTGVQPSGVRTSGGYVTTQPATLNTLRPSTQTTTIGGPTTTYNQGQLKPLTVGGPTTTIGGTTAGSTVQRGPVTGTTTIGQTNTFAAPGSPTNAPGQSLGSPKSPTSPGQPGQTTGSVSPSPPGNTQTAVFASQLPGPGTSPNPSSPTQVRK